MVYDGISTDESARVQIGKQSVAVERARHETESQVYLRIGLYEELRAMNR